MSVRGDPIDSPPRVGRGSCCLTLDWCAPFDRLTSNDAGIGGIIRLLQTHGGLLWGDYNGVGSEDSQMVLAGWIAQADEVV